MILNQTIRSARAENRRDFAAGRIVRAVLTAFLASALTLPSLAAWGMEGSPRWSAEKTSEMLPLPPIQYLESIPWMKWERAAQTLRIDTLMTPSLTPGGGSFKILGTSGLQSRWSADQRLGAMRTASGRFALRGLILFKPVLANKINRCQHIAAGAGSLAARHQAFVHLASSPIWLRADKSKSGFAVLTSHLPFSRPLRGTESPDRR